MKSIFAILSIVTVCLVACKSHEVAPTAEPTKVEATADVVQEAVIVE